MTQPASGSRARTRSQDEHISDSPNPRHSSSRRVVLDVDNPELVEQLMARILNHPQFKAVIDTEVQHRLTVAGAESAARLGDVELKLQAAQDKLAAAEGRILQLTAATNSRQEDDGRVDRALDRVDAVQAQQEAVDKTMRRKNLVVRGLAEEVPGQTAEGTVDALLRETGTAVPLLEARRLGRVREVQAGRPPAPRPVLLVFPSEQAKHSALKHSAALRARRIYLDDDLTPAQLQARASLGDKFTMLRQQGLHPFWRADRLFYRDANNRATLFQGEVLPSAPAGVQGAGAGRSGPQAGRGRQAGRSGAQAGRSGSHGGRQAGLGAAGAGPSSGAAPAWGRQPMQA